MCVCGEGAGVEVCKPRGWRGRCACMLGGGVSMPSWGHRQAGLGYSNTVGVSTERPLRDKNPSPHQEIKPAS